MKKQQLNELKNLSIKELVARIKSLQEEVAKNVMDKNIDKLNNLKIISKNRKDLAQTLTILNQKQILQKLEAIIKVVKG